MLGDMLIADENIFVPWECTLLAKYILKINYVPSVHTSGAYSQAWVCYRSMLWK
jgi:hypothetical protein